MTVHSSAPSGETLTEGMVHIACDDHRLTPWHFLEKLADRFHNENIRLGQPAGDINALIQRKGEPGDLFELFPGPPIVRTGIFDKVDSFPDVIRETLRKAKSIFLR